MPDESAYVIQEFLSPRKNFPVSLYIDGSTTTGQYATGKANLVQLSSEETYSTDTYFNSLYVGYWIKHTSVRNFGIAIKLKGHIELAILACDLSGNETLIDKSEIKSRQVKNTVNVWFGLEELENQKGIRIFARLTAKSDTSISRMDYITDCSPEREIALSLGLCTFRREADLANTLAAISEIRAQCSEIKMITIVNHDKPFTDKALIESAAELGARIIEQPNLGGCGGFNRTMYEAVNSNTDITHHLLMDDDIELDPRIIVRSVRFLSYASPKTVLGGHMFDSVQRTVLHEAGARLDPFWYVTSLFQDENMASKPSLNNFGLEQEADYNAWWFCAFPVKAIEEIGYSPPIFIHGDDIEYGCRLGQFGYQTVSLPGVAVWHESFAAKNTDWLQYYDLRNRLVIAVNHGEKSPQPDTLYCFGFLMHLLLMHRYRAAEMCIAALGDFLDGPDKLFEVSADKRHQMVNSLGEQLDNVTTVKGVDTDQFAVAIPDARQNSQLKIAFYLARSFLSVMFLPSRSVPDTIHTNKSANPSVLLNKPYLLVNGTSGDEYLEFRPRRMKLMRGVVKAAAISLRYLMKRKSVEREWREKLPTYQSREAWEKIFFGTD